jgi:lipoate-protein ligase A
MALDEALLESLAAGARGPTLRFYQWSPPSVSLGVFQPFADYERAVARAGVVPVDVVRRITGGGAIRHDREWTYSLVIARSDPLARGDPGGLYRAVHAGLIAGLRRLGVAVRLRLRGAGGCAPSAGCGDFFCFERGDPNDVVADDGRKIVGSAARRLPEAVLQHGSIVIEAPVGSPKATSVAEQLGRSIDDAAVLRACVEGLSAALELSLPVGVPTPAELARARELANVKHAAADWLRRR